MFKRLLGLYFILSCSNLFAQNNFLRHYSINEGLPSSETYMAMQDRKGYIWIASDLGVSRFDGYNFTVYTTAEGLTDNTVFSFHEDPKGRIWFYTFSGRLCYYYNDTIYGKELELNNQLHDLLKGHLISSIKVDAHDTILIATFNGLYKIIPSLENGATTWKKIEVLADKATFLLKDEYITCEAPVYHETLLITHSGKSKNDSLLTPWPAISVILLRRLPDQSLLLFYGTFTWRVFPNGRIVEAKNLDQVLDVYHENDSMVWISQKRHGVHLFNVDRLQQAEKSFLEEFSVTSTLKDHENGYWFTTLEDGVFYLPTTRFNHFPPVTDSMLYSESALFSIDTERIWLATRHKIFESKKQGKFKEVCPALLSKLPKPNKLVWWNGLKHSDGTTWLSTAGGVAILNKSDELIKYLDFAKDTTIEPHSRMTQEDRDMNVWSLNLSNLTKINHADLSIEKRVLLPARAGKMVVDTSGNVIITTIEGLYSYGKDSLHYWGRDNELFKQRFTDLKLCDGNLVAATKSAGLLIVTGDSVYRITVNNGLSTNMCRSICVDGPGMIWVGTNRGLNAISFSFNPFTTSIRQYTVADGLLNNDIDQVVKNGSIVWVRYKKGITAFDPLVATKNTVPPPVYITGLTLNNSPHTLQEQSVLDFGSSIGFNYTGLTYKVAGKQNYKYKLEGIDTSWTYSNSTSVQFSRLPPGNYIFKVLCINNSGLESSHPAIYRFTIRAPFYKKWWFSVIVFLLANAFVVIIAVLVVRRIRRREEAKTEMNRQIANHELQALRAQMNPHFIFNCLNAIQDFILRNDSSSARRYLSSFSKLIRKTLNHSRRHEITLAEEAEFVELYLGLEKMRFNNRFDYHVKFHNNINPESILIPSMIIQPFVENAVKHGKIGSMEKMGELKIDFFIKDDGLVCVIDDNGIGIQKSLKMKNRPSHTNETHAMDIMNDRMRTMSAVNQTGISYTVADKAEISSLQTGTIAQVFIPITK